MMRCRATAAFGAAIALAACSRSPSPSIAPTASDARASDASSTTAASATEHPPGAPTDPTAEIDAGAPEGQSASTTATTVDGDFTISGIDDFAIHTHGGPDARLSRARFEIVNRAKKPRTVSAEHVDFLVGRSCARAPEEARSSPVPRGLVVEGSGQTTATPTVSIHAGATGEVRVVFAAPVDAYYTHCDRFAFRAYFRVGSEVLTVVAETNVQREDP